MSVATNRPTLQRKHSINWVAFRRSLPALHQLRMNGAMISPAMALGTQKPATRKVISAGDPPLQTGEPNTLHKPKTAPPTRHASRTNSTTSLMELKAVLNLPQRFRRIAQSTGTAMLPTADGTVKNPAG